MSELAKKVVHKMYDNDPFSKWLGIELVSIEEGKVICEMTIREEMLNGFQIAHGGIVFCLADSTFAFATNTYGIKSVSIEASLTWPKAINLGDRIRAEAIQKTLTNKTAVFDINITNQNDEMVGLFRGTVYRTGKPWFPED